MSRRRKLEKFAKLLEYPHVFEMTEPGSTMLKRQQGETIEMNGKWRNKAFDHPHPLTVELACGRGEYTLGLAQLFNNRNFLGVDIKGARIYQGAMKALTEELPNVAFLRTRIEQLDLYFDAGEIDEIWITFPDPFPAKPNRRLTASIFLDRYHSLLSSGGQIHLKTDDEELFFYSVEEGEKHTKYDLIFKSENISKIRKISAELNIMTYYESMHLSENKTIKYLILKKKD